MTEPVAVHQPEPMGRLLDDLLLGRDHCELPDALLAYDWGDAEPFAVALGDAECDNSTLLIIGRESPLARPTEPWELDAESLAGLIEQGQIVLLDVRTAEEYARDHIPEAQWVGPDRLESCLMRLGTDALVVLICRSGSRSGQTAVVWQERGFRNVRHVCGGMLGWTGPTAIGWDERADAERRMSGSIRSAVRLLGVTPTDACFPGPMGGEGSAPGRIDARQGGRWS